MSKFLNEPKITYTAEDLNTDFVSRFTETKFVQFLRENRIKFRKHYNDIHVGNDVYQFGRDGRFLGYGD